MSIEANPTTKRELEISLQNKLIGAGDFPTCISCVKFDAKDEMCGLYKARPPLKFVVTGCVNWENDIPF